MFLAVFDNNSMYVRCVYTEEEYENLFGHLSSDYRPSCEHFETREAAEQYQAAQNENARRQYSAG
jgi:hypothetical protein